MPAARREVPGLIEQPVDDPSTASAPKLSPPAGDKTLASGTLVLKTSLGSAYAGCADQTPHWEDEPAIIKQDGSLRLPGKREVMIAYGEVIVNLIKPKSHARTICFKYTLAQHQTLLVSPDGLVRIRIKALSDAAYRIKSVTLLPLPYVPSTPGSATEEGDDDRACRSIVKEMEKLLRDSIAGGPRQSSSDQQRPDEVTNCDATLDIETEDDEQEPEPELKPAFDMDADEWLSQMMNEGVAGARQRAMEAMKRIQAAETVRDAQRLAQLAEEAETEEERLSIMRQQRSLEHEGFGRQYNAHDHKTSRASSGSQPAPESSRRGASVSYKVGDLSLNDVQLTSNWWRARNSVRPHQILLAKSQVHAEERKEYIQWKQYCRARELMHEQFVLHHKSETHAAEWERLAQLQRNVSHVPRAAHRLPVSIGLMDGAVKTTSPICQRPPPATANGRSSASAQTALEISGEAPMTNILMGEGKGEGDEVDNSHTALHSALPALLSRWSSESLISLASGEQAGRMHQWPDSAMLGSDEHARNYNTCPQRRPPRPVNPPRETRVGRYQALLERKVSKTSESVLIPASVVELSAPFSSSVARIAKCGELPKLARSSIQDIEVSLSEIDSVNATSMGEEAASIPDDTLPPILSGERPVTLQDDEQPARSPPARLPVIRPTSRPASPTPMALRTFRLDASMMDPPNLPAEPWPHPSPRLWKAMIASQMAAEEAMLRAWEQHHRAQIRNPEARAGSTMRSFKPAPSLTPRLRANGTRSTPAIPRPEEVDCSLKSILSARHVGDKSRDVRERSQSVLGEIGVAQNSSPLQMVALSPTRSTLSSRSSKWHLGGMIPSWAQESIMLEDDVAPATAAK